jgi:hypothetical protein
MSLLADVSGNRVGITTRRQLPRRGSGAMETRLSERVLAASGVLLLPAITLLGLSRPTGDAKGFVAGYLSTQSS